MESTLTRINEHPLIRFGGGDRPLVIVPGLSDALQGDTSPRFVQLLLERYYMRAFADEFDVHVVSRPRELPEDVTTRELAAEYATVIAEIGPADVLGISMGGLIAQYLGIDHPENVQNLIFAVSGPQLSESGRRIVSDWLDAARDGRWGEVYLGTVEATYSSAARRAAYGALLKLPRVVREPPYPEDFIASATACLEHDSSGDIDAIDTRTLVIGGEEDVLFAADDLRRMATRMPTAELRLFEETGHGVYEERRSEFSTAVTSFLSADG